jgi:FecR protein
VARLKFAFELLLVLTVSCLVTIPVSADSQARIVRLGDAQGNVRIDRNTGQGYEKAFLNLPITQGMKIQTGDDGRAALELEDGSTVRLAPDSVLEVPQLSLRDSGSKVSAFHLQEGTAYINFLGAKESEFTLTFARETVRLGQAVHLRVEMGDTYADLAVFKGAVQVAAPTGNVEVTKGKTASFDLISDKYELASEIADAPFDSWDKQQGQFQQEYSSKSYASYSPYPYGTSDLNYYGSFFNAPGYGNVWQPYFAGAGWDPFMDGAWAFYPGSGYGWVSAYPWGWTPFHYGSWSYLPTNGWVWQPGGAWTGFNNIPLVTNAPRGFTRPQAPTISGGRLLAVNRGPVITQVGKSANHVQIPNNSAGLGIPRGSVANLRDLSHTAQQKGAVTTTLHTGPGGLAGWLNSGYGSLGGGTSGARGGVGNAGMNASSSGNHASVGHSSSGAHR